MLTATSTSAQLHDQPQGLKSESVRSVAMVEHANKHLMINWKIVSDGVVSLKKTSSFESRILNNLTRLKLC